MIEIHMSVTRRVLKSLFSARTRYVLDGTYTYLDLHAVGYIRSSSFYTIEK